MRRATPSSTVMVILRKNFYPRSPCGERPHNTKNNCIDCCISIHALLAESDRETTSIKPVFGISIHALLAESDPLRQLQFALCGDFYPRSPCGERQPATRRNDKNNMISIHALLAESDQVKQTCRVETSISIHALLAESDVRVCELVWGVSISIHALLAESDT